MCIPRERTHLGEGVPGFILAEGIPVVVSNDYKACFRQHQREMALWNYSVFFNSKYTRHGTKNKLDSLVNSRSRGRNLISMYHPC